ncbi:MAG: class I SAM-dependent methyltransferase [Verrucomicrobiota bacterium]
MRQFEAKDAETYDFRIQRLVPGYDLMHGLGCRVLKSVLPDRARVLLAGVGTGKELAEMAEACPFWRFVAVDPSSAMLDRAMMRARKAEFVDRVSFVESTIEDCEGLGEFEGATSYLVSHFLPDDGGKLKYFSALTKSLKKGGLLVCSDFFDTNEVMITKAYSEWLGDSFADEEKAKQVMGHISRSFHPLNDERLSGLLGGLGMGLPQEYFSGLVYRGFFASKSEG